MHSGDYFHYTPANSLQETRIGTSKELALNRSHLGISNDRTVEYLFIAFLFRSFRHQNAQQATCAVVHFEEEQHKKSYRHKANRCPNVAINGATRIQISGIILHHMLDRTQSSTVNSVIDIDGGP